MHPFKLPLSNGAVVTGLHNLPAPSPTASRHRPLIVALHGGTYTAKYFDVNASHTASTTSDGLRVPLVAINRPGYLDSTSFAPIPDGSSYPEEYGAWLHQYILPTLWLEFGKPSGCNCIVLHCHSLGTTGAIISASMYAKDANKQYPLGGISTSGFGIQLAGSRYRPPQDPHNPPTTITFPPEVKDSIMLQTGHADPEMYSYTEELNHDVPIEEITSIDSVWFPRWKEWAGNVEVPVMIGLAGHDLMWKGTEEHLRDYAGAFSKSERVDGSVIKGAPHNLEMSYWAPGWYARCFGFALECAASFAQNRA